jgi:hypothetical protein
MRLANSRRTSSNQRSAGFSSGLAGGQWDREQVRRPANLVAGMTPAAVEHEAERPVRELLAHGVEKELEAHTIRMRQEQNEAAAAARLDHSIQPQPAVLMLMNPGRSLTKRTPQPSMRHFETEARFIEGQDVFHFKLGERGAEVLF